MEAFNKFKEDKLSLLLLLIIFSLGIFIRLDDYSEVGYWNDDISTVPSGLLWFYPHSYFPGLSGVSEPPLGNMIIGAGCMLSGEDFSRVSEIKPTFYPGREELIGKQLVKAESYCHLPIYLFGILFFIILIFLSFSVLEKYSALFAISFFAFYPVLLNFSRWIHVDVILYFFAASFLLFLWKFYISEKNSNKEITLLSISAIFIGLASATKFSIGTFIFFGIFIIFNKYKEEFLSLLKKMLKYLNLEAINRIKHEADYRRLIILLTLFSLIFLIVFLAPFQLNPKNAIDTYERYTKFTSPEFAKAYFDFNLARILNYTFLSNVNLIDTLIFLFSIFMMFKLFSIKKEKNEKFILYFISFFLISAVIFSQALDIPRISLPYLIGVVFLMSMAFSSRPYSLLELFKIHKKKIFFTTFILIYIIYAFSIAYSTSPYFTASNPITCHFTRSKCEPGLAAYSAKATGDYLNNILKDNETFMGMEGVIFYYVRQEQSLQNFYFEQIFQQKTGRLPTAEEKIKYFHPYNQSIRYILLNANPISGRDYTDLLLVDLRDNYEPNHKIILINKEVVWIYDLENLKTK